MLPEIMTRALFHIWKEIANLSKGVLSRMTSTIIGSIISTTGSLMLMAFFLEFFIRIISATQAILKDLVRQCHWG